MQDKMLVFYFTYLSSLYFIFHIKATRDPVFEYFISKKVNMNDDSIFLKSHEGLANVQQQRYAFHCEANTAFPIIAKTFSQTQICNLNVIPFRRERMQGFIIRKYSPFHDIFAVKYVQICYLFISVVYAAIYILMQNPSML